MNWDSSKLVFTTYVTYLANDHMSSYETSQDYKMVILGGIIPV